MADPTKIEEVLRKLNDLKGFIDVEIRAYNEAKRNVEGNHRVAENKVKMEEAQAEIMGQVGRIDSLILDDPEIAALIGETGYKDVEDLNDTIRSVLDKVADLKSLGMKDKSNNDVSLQTDTREVVDRIEELKATSPTRDYSRIDQEIEDLEAIVVDEEVMTKYESVKDKIAAKKSIDREDVDVLEALKEDIDTVKTKLTEYKAYSTLASFDTSSFKKVYYADTFMNSINKPKAEEWYFALRDAKGDEEITIGGNKFKIKDLKDSGEFFAKFEGLNQKEFKAAIQELTRISVVSKDDLDSKKEELRDSISTSTTMELFDSDKAELETILRIDPVDTRKIGFILNKMKDPDKENIKLLEKLAGDPAEIAKARAELENLRKIRESIKKEADARAADLDLKEFETVTVDGIEVKLHKDKYKGRFVDLEPGKRDNTDVVEATYSNLDRKTLRELNNRVVETAGDDKLPRHIPFFSKLVAQFRPDKKTTRERAIETRAKKMIRKGIQEEIARANGDASGRKDRDIEDAENAKNDLFRVDKETLDKIEKAAKQYIIDQRGKTTVEEAREEAGRE